MDKKILLGLYPEYTSVLGPYDRPDGRKHVVLNNSNASKGTEGKTKTISYPKALVEISLNRRLEKNETVDHHNRDHTDNDVDKNLFIREKVEHAILDAVRVHVEEVACSGCGTLFTPSKDQRNRQGPGDQPAGPFCSKRCTGIYAKNIQMGGQKLERTEVKKTYYRERK